MLLKMTHRVESGFTLVELLVSIGIISILIGLLLPSLHGVKARANQLKALNDLRQIGVSMHLYVEDSGGYFPFFLPDTPHFIGPLEDPLGIIYVGYDDPWSTHYLWPTVMHRVAPWREHYITWIGVGQEYGSKPWLRADSESRWLPPAYRMSNSFVATPGTWSDEGIARIQSTRPEQVRYPSAKVMFFDGARPYLSSGARDRQSRGVLIADGSARGVDDRDATVPVKNRLTGLQPKLYHDTPNGINGRDF